MITRYADLQLSFEKERGRFSSWKIVAYLHPDKLGSQILPISKFPGEDGRAYGIETII